MLESYFCPSLLQTGFTSTCLAQQPACDCDFTQPSCPNRLSPQCCADLLSELNGPLSSVDGHVCDAASFSVPAISLSAVNPIIRVAHQTSALGVFSSPTNGSSLRSFPTRTWSVYLDHPTACGFMALRARLRPDAGFAELFVSKKELQPLSHFGSRFYPPTVAPSWRGSFRGPGDDVNIAVCLDDPNAGPGTYFVMAVCESIRCIYDIDLQLIPFDKVSLNQPLLATPSSVNSLLDCTLPDCVALTDGVSSAVALSSRTPKFAAVLVNSPELIHVEVSRDWEESVSVTVGVTIDGKDPQVEAPMWRESSFATTHRFSLSFLDSSATHNLTFPIRVSLRLLARGIGVIHLLATSRARFSVVPLDTIPPLPARSRLIGTSYFQNAATGEVFYCPPLIATQAPTPTALIGDYCDARYWAFAPSDQDSANPMILTSMDTIESSSTYVPVDFTSPEFLAVRTPLAKSYTSFWLSFWWPIDLSYVETFPPGPIFQTPGRVLMSFRLVSIGGYLPANPSFASSLFDAIGSVSELGLCNGTKYRNNLDLTLSTVRQSVTPPLYEQYSKDFISIIKQLGDDPAAGRTTSFSVAMFADWYTMCTDSMAKLFTKGFYQQSHVVGRSCSSEIDATGELVINSSDPCCVGSLQFNDPCDWTVRYAPTLFTRFITDPALNTTECPVITASEQCFSDAVSYPASTIEDQPTHCSSNFCAGTSSFSVTSALAQFLNSNILGGGCQNGVITGTRRISELARSRCSNHIFGSSPLLGIRCHSDSDCLNHFPHATGEVTCDLYRNRCRNSDYDTLNEFITCLHDHVSPLTFSLMLRGLGLPEEGQSLTQIVDWFASPESPLWNPNECVYNSVDGRVEHIPSVGSVDFAYDRSCIDELSLSRSPTYASFALFRRESPPYLPNPLLARTPREVCPQVQFSTLSTYCLPREHALCNWHAVVGCTQEEAADFCLRAPFDTLSCPDWIASLPPPVVPPQRQEGCFACHADRCQEFPQFTTPEACESAPLCEYQNGRFDLCPPSSSPFPAAWCSQPCPGSSCTSARFGTAGACLGHQLSEKQCKSLHGVWMSDFATCRFYLARTAADCPAPYQWVQCSALSVENCGSLPAPQQTLALCFVDRWTTCTSESACTGFGGRCVNESSSSYPSSLPPAVETGVPYPQDLHSDPMILAISPSLFQNFYAFPPVWGACVFSQLDIDLVLLDVSRYCAQFPNGAAAETLPRVTIPSGCIDYNILNSTSCLVLGGEWRTPAETRQACLSSYATANVCVGGQLNQRTNYSEAECVQSPTRNYFPSGVWLAGRWVAAQPRQGRWLARSFVAPRAVA
ncbi:MAG: hypothetical protein Q8P67_05310, partial [archaeon]|nr:hypothetical protein [archaeon]